MTKSQQLVLVLALGIFSLGGIAHADTLDSITSGTGDLPFSAGASNYSIFWAYNPSATHAICSATVTLKTNGTPIDQVQINLNIGSTTYGTFGSALNTTLYQASQKASITSSYTDYTFNFSPCPVVVASNWYSFELFRTGSIDTTNYYTIKGRNASGVALTITGTWLADLLTGPQHGTFHGNSLPTVGGNITLNGTNSIFSTGIPNPQVTGGDALTQIYPFIDASTSAQATSTGYSLGGFLNVFNLLNSKFPFNYVSTFASDFEIFGTATTSTFYNWSISFPVTGTSTGFQVLPASWTFLSSTTVSTYFPDSIRLTFRALVGVLLAAGWGFYMFRRITAVFNTTS